MTPNKSIRDYELDRPSYVSDDETYQPLIVQRLLQNGMRTPDGTEIFSRSVHDYVVHNDENGEQYMVDGGNEYLRRSVNTEPAEDLSVYVDDDHEINRENFVWGTYGKDGDQPLTWKKLCDMSTAHIKAVLVTQQQIPEWRREIFETELEYRLNGELAEIAADKR